MTDLPLQVLVTGAEGTPWAGITVRITASENNGATLAPCGTEAVTNDDGLAIFEDFQINKPGTVHLTARTIETPEGTNIGLISSLAELDDRLGALDLTQPYPGEGAEGPRGRAGSPKVPAVPDGWLASRELDDALRARLAEAELGVSGG